MNPFPLSQLPEPNSELTPQIVVALQLDALQIDDLVPGNQGIRAAFKFASPSNQAQIGPIERFIQLLKTDRYRPMIGFERAELDIFRVLGGDLAQQRVVLLNGKSDPATYMFILSIQERPPYAGCWMTDAVLREH
jgi:hypothetical protein